MCTLKLLQFNVRILKGINKFIKNGTVEEKNVEIQNPPTNIESISFNEKYRLEAVAALDDVDFVVGGKVNNTHTYRDSFWYGCIDEIRLWNVART